MRVSAPCSRCRSEIEAMIYGSVWRSANDERIKHKDILVANYDYIVFLYQNHQQKKLRSVVGYTHMHDTRENDTHVAE